MKWSCTQWLKSSDFKRPKVATDSSARPAVTVGAENFPRRTGLPSGSLSPTEGGSSVQVFRAPRKTCPEPSLAKVAIPSESSARKGWSMAAVTVERISAPVSPSLSRYDSR
eukprot:scaffold1340_cov253-Pinguiococcus_pyrenoidosus.AAC.32